ncbi:family 10 glycosyl hydrolase [Thozetella sp. PMI_491]|nr:family 10 glycosyl hydrolase [Thozetella sp. PMI_491]
MSVRLTGCSVQSLAKKAGLEYFGTATDSPGQRERAGFEPTYVTYDTLFRDPKQFGQTTPTNGMKWLFTEPSPGVFNYTEGEIVASLAKENGKLLRCHALVWHNQLAPWVETTNWTASALRSAIVRHIEHVAGHWKGRCYAWDVVNEALDEDGTYRKSLFYNVLGEEYIKLAFQTAARVDPHAKLYYNDYGIEKEGVKAAGARRIVKLLKDAHIKLDGVGLQGHLHAETHPTIDQHIDVMKSFTALDVDVAITELDIRIQLPLNATNLEGQKQGYKAIVGACVQVDGCAGVTLWDFYDAFSWVPATFPGQGAAGIWYDNFTIHSAYYGIIEALQNGTSQHH